MAKKPAPQSELFDLSTIKQQFQELEAKKRAELLEEKNKMLAPLHEQAEKQRKIVDDATAKLNEIERMIASLTGVSTKRAGGAVSSGRQRRSPEQLKETAQAVVEFIGSKKDGVAGSEIMERYGKLTPSVTKFLEAQGYKAGKDFKTTGVKASMKYFGV